MPKIQFKRKKSTGIGTNKLSAGEPLYNLQDKKLYIAEVYGLLLVVVADFIIPCSLAVRYIVRNQRTIYNCSFLTYDVSQMRTSWIIEIRTTTYSSPRLCNNHVYR